MGDNLQTERADYMKRLLNIEKAKAEERKRGGTNLVENSPEGRSRDIVSEQFGISSNTMEREISIVDNAELLTPEDFADWDEGRLSTNKAYQKDQFFSTKSTELFLLSNSTKT